ncbi:MAG: hypothetical protein IKU86_11380 [Thermoguttaceae bacterium]|nr:hypothetical protein [Thermoguttaceae bacterium]
MGASTLKRRREKGFSGVGGGAVPLRTFDILTRTERKINRAARFLPRFCRFIKGGEKIGVKKTKKRRRERQTFLIRRGRESV